MAVKAMCSHVFDDPQSAKPNQRHSELCCATAEECQTNQRLSDPCFSTAEKLSNKINGYQTHVFDNAKGVKAIFGLGLTSADLALDRAAKTSRIPPGP